MDKMNEVNRAHDALIKFRFFMVSLCFTILALSIQTNKLGVSNWYNIFEIGGWIMFALSGWLGLRSVEHYAFSEMASGMFLLVSRLEALESTSSVGNGEYGKEKAQASEERDYNNRMSSRLNNIQKLTFLFGLIFIMTSRILFGLNIGK